MKITVHVRVRNGSSTNMAESLAPSYVLDPAKSRFQVRASATGLLSAFGHNPTIAIRNFTGEAWYRPQAPEQSSLRVEIDAASLAVDWRRQRQRPPGNGARHARGSAGNGALFPRSALKAMPSRPAGSPRACIA